MKNGPGTTNFETAENLATRDYLRSAIDHAPQYAGDTADDLLGWWTADGWYVCAKCAGRIMARGCQLPSGSVPVWKDPAEPTGVCCCCE